MRYNKKTTQATLFGRISAATALGFLITFTTSPGVQIATAVPSTCASITECTNQINANRSAVADLRDQAVSYKDAVTRLQSEINQVQGEINESQRQQNKLEAEIADAQKQIDYQKVVLGESLRTMYIDGELSTIEALATSNKLSDYVDKEEYRNALQASIQRTLKKISALQAQLQTQKAVVAGLLSQQRSQMGQLAASRGEQSRLLNLNQSQQAAYNAQTSANQSKLNALIEAQRRANSGNSAGGYAFIRFPGAARNFNPSAYPYANAGFSMSTAPGCNDNDGPDKWGYCTRQCVSYAAWAVEASGRSAPRYWGNAKNWDDRARAAGIPVYSSPQPGDVAVSNSGTWGHVMYVEEVSGGSFRASEYNQRVDGRLRTDRWVKWN